MIFFQGNATFLLIPASYYHKHQKYIMRSIRNILLTLSNWEIFNSRSSFYLLLVAFIILLLAAENLIKTTMLPI